MYERGVVGLVVAHSNNADQRVSNPHADVGRRIPNRPTLYDTGKNIQCGSVNGSYPLRCQGYRHFRFVVITEKGISGVTEWC